MSETKHANGIEVAMSGCPRQWACPIPLTPRARLQAGILNPLGKEGESPMLLVMSWCATAALSYWFGTLVRATGEKEGSMLDKLKKLWGKTSHDERETFLAWVKK